MPDGKNINLKCGSLFPKSLSEAVVENKAQIGIAYDGDADRVLWADETGRILNGDHTLLVLAKYMQENNSLKSDFVVATPMSNMGLEKALQQMELQLVRAPVGDRFVLEEMLKLKANLGGEQSGHTILLDECSTGDGILTSIKMLEVMITRKKNLSQLAAGLKEFPQILLNVSVSKRAEISQHPEIVQAAAAIEKTLGNDGRINVRYSGTEPIVRIMIEGQDIKQITEMAEGLASIIKKYLNE